MSVSDLLHRCLLVGAALLLVLLGVAAAHGHDDPAPRASVALFRR